MSSRADLAELDALCWFVQDGSLRLPADAPMTLEEFRAAMGDRAEALFGTARKDAMLERLHAVLWPRAERKN